MFIIFIYLKDHAHNRPTLFDHTTDVAAQLYVKLIYCGRLQKNVIQVDELTGHCKL